MSRRRAVAAGIASVLDLGGEGTAKALRSRRHREDSIWDDWRAVGRDLDWAIGRVASERDDDSRRTGE